MAKGGKSEDDLDWDHVFSKGAYCIGGGFMVGCGLSILTSSTWPVLFSTGVGFGLACVNLESQMWNKGQKGSVTFENPWMKAKERTVVPAKPDEDAEWDAAREREITIVGMKREGGRSLETPRPHWRPDQDPVPVVPMEKDRREEEAYPGKDRGYSGKDRDYPGKEWEHPEARDNQERESRDREYRDREFPREAKPCPRAPRRKAQSNKKESEAKEKKDITMEADPELLVD